MPQASRNTLTDPPSGQTSGGTEGELVRHNEYNALGDWRIETSHSRFLPSRAGLRLESEGAGFALTVTWKDADQLAMLRRSGGLLDFAKGRASLVFATPDGEKHRFVAVLDTEAKRRRLFGFIVSSNEREETGTGAWTAVEEDPADDQSPAQGSGSPAGTTSS
jgi:hypothetical protein